MRALRLLVIDLAAFLLAGYLALLIRDNFDFSAEHFEGMSPYIGFSFAAGLLIFPIIGINRSLWRYSTFGDFLRIGAASLLVVLAATTLTFAFNRLEGLARAIPILHFILAVGLLGAVRASMRFVHEMRSRPRAGTDPERLPGEQVLIVGLNVVASLFVRSANEFAADRIHVVGVLGTSDRHRGGLLQGVPILGLPEDVEAILRQLDVHGVNVDRIVVALTQRELSPAIREALEAVENGSEVRVDYFSERLGFSERPASPAVSKASGVRSGDPGDTLPSLRNVLDHAVLSRPYWRWKRLFDLVVAFVLIVATLPLMLVVALLVMLDIGQPVVFWQQRPGACGRRLRLYKFRTMRAAHDGDGNRVPEEARVSRIGTFLRRSRLDELPQLFNILVGQMSFVGPRPLLPVDQSPAFSGRLAVRPGLTGWAQVNGGRQVSALDKATMDLWYIRNASFSLDIRIAFMTLRMLVYGEKTDQRAIAAAWREIEAWRAQTASA